MFLIRGFFSLAYCDHKLDHLKEIRHEMQQQVNLLKQKYGTQMMSYPNIMITVKDNNYTVSFPIDRRRNTLNNVIDYLDNGIKHQGIQLKKKENNKIWNVDCTKYYFSDGQNDFIITLQGPNNEYFYTFEYSKPTDFNNDSHRIRDIYELANKPNFPTISRTPHGQLFKNEPAIRGDPVQNLQDLGAKVFQPQDTYLEWDYLAGYEEAKQEIEDTVLLTLKYPEIYDKITQFTRVKAEINRPRAVLFEGPPGTGKTTSAKIIAHQVKIPMVYVRLESVVSMYYGEAEKNLGKIFDNCKALGKCIIFIDEIDSLAQSREREMHEATRRMLGVFLRYIDGFESNENVMVICATNRKQDLDPALQSRFSKVINFPYPDLLSRQAIFRQYARHLNDDQLRHLASNSEGMAGRDIKSICEDAERQWAAKLLKGETQEYEVDFELYNASLQSRMGYYKSSY